MDMSYVWIALGWMAFVAIAVVALTAIVIVVVRNRGRRSGPTGGPWGPQQQWGPSPQWGPNGPFPGPPPQQQAPVATGGPKPAADATEGRTSHDA